MASELSKLIEDELQKVDEAPPAKKDEKKRLLGAMRIKTGPQRPQKAVPEPGIAPPPPPPAYGWVWDREQWAWTRWRVVVLVALSLLLGFAVWSAFTHPSSGLPHLQRRGYGFADSMETQPVAEGYPQQPQQPDALAAPGGVPRTKDTTSSYPETAGGGTGASYPASGERSERPTGSSYPGSLVGASDYANQASEQEYLTAPGAHNKPAVAGAGSTQHHSGTKSHNPHSAAKFHHPQHGQHGHSGGAAAWAAGTGAGAGANAAATIARPGLTAALAPAMLRPPGLAPTGGMAVTAPAPGPGLAAGLSAAPAPAPLGAARAPAPGPAARLASAPGVVAPRTSARLGPAALGDEAGWGGRGEAGWEGALAQAQEEVVGGRGVAGAGAGAAQWDEGALEASEERGGEAAGTLGAGAGPRAREPYAELEGVGIPQRGAAGAGVREGGGLAAAEAGAWAGVPENTFDAAPEETGGVYPVEEEDDGEGGSENRGGLGWGSSFGRKLLVKAM